MSRHIFLNLACTLWGCLGAVVATLWCLGGAGIYGSPLPGMGKEAWFVVAYLVIGVGSSFVAGLLVWVRPLLASRTLFVGALLSLPLAGRYLWFHPAAILAFCLPGIMVLLAWSIRGIKKHAEDDTLRQIGGRRSSTHRTFILMELFLLITTIALAITHGRLAWVPPYTPTLLMQEFCGILHPESRNELETLRREKRDLERFLEVEYGIRFHCLRGGSSGAGQFVELDWFRARHLSADDPRPDLIADLESVMQTLVIARGLQIERRNQASGSRFARRGMLDGFSIRYRGRNVEGLIQAAAIPGTQRADMYVEERLRRNLLSLGRSHHVSYHHDW